MTPLVWCEYFNDMVKITVEQNELVVRVRYSLLKYDYKILHKITIGDMCHLIRKL